MLGLLGGKRGAIQVETDVENVEGLELSDPRDAPRPVAVDGSLVTPRKSDDIPHVNDASVAAVAGVATT